MNKTLHNVFIIFSLMLVSFAGLNVGHVVNAQQVIPVSGLTYSNTYKSVANESYVSYVAIKQPKTKSKEVQSDTTLQGNSIKVWENSTGEVLMALNLKDTNQYIEITVWNMLGKIVLYDYKGKYSDLEKEHVINNSSSLARGAYLVRMTGNKSKLDAKFIKTK